MLSEDSLRQPIRLQRLKRSFCGQAMLRTSLWTTELRCLVMKDEIGLTADK